MKRNPEELKEIESYKSSFSTDFSSSNEQAIQSQLCGLKEKKVHPNSLARPNSNTSVFNEIELQNEEDNSSKPCETDSLTSTSTTVTKHTSSSRSNGKQDVFAVQSSVPCSLGKKKTTLDSSYSESEEDCEFVSHKVLFSYKSVFVNSIVDITEEDKVFICTVHYIEPSREKTETK